MTPWKLDKAAKDHLDLWKVGAPPPQKKWNAGQIYVEWWLIIVS